MREKQMGKVNLVPKVAKEAKITQESGKRRLTLSVVVQGNENLVDVSVGTSSSSRTQSKVGVTVVDRSYSNWVFSVTGDVRDSLVTRFDDWGSRDGQSQGDGSDEGGEDLHFERINEMRLLAET